MTGSVRRGPAALLQQPVSFKNFHQCVMRVRRNTPQLAKRRARARYVLLYQLATHQQTLLYYALINNLEELAPIVYTPTVGAIPCPTYFTLPLILWYPSIASAHAKVVE